MNHDAGINRKQSRTKDGKLRYYRLHQNYFIFGSKKDSGIKGKVFIIDILEVLYTAVTTKELCPGERVLIASHILLDF